MISEVMFGDVYFEFNYSIIVVACDSNVCELLINNQKYMCSETARNNLINHLESAQELCSIALEKIIDINIENNNLYLIVKTIEGVIYKTTFSGLKKRSLARTNFEARLHDDGYELLSTYVDAKEPVLIDYKCGHGPQATSPNSYLVHNIRCAICSHKKIVPYINDCYAIRPDLLKYFVNKNDAIGLSVSNKTKMDFICPTCGNIRKNTLANISYFGFSCPVCGDGISYPEKFMYSLLMQIAIPFEYHFRPNWGAYVLDGRSKKSEYDFVLHDMKLIIEMDGAFHYGDCGELCKTDSKAIDENKDRLAAENGYRIIRVDCYYKNNTYRFDYICNNVISSLCEILDLSTVDWKSIEKNAVSSLLVKACELWNSGMTTEEISNEININKTSVIEYLKRGTGIDLCWYTKELSNLRQAKNVSSKYYCYCRACLCETDEVIGVFYDIDNFIYNYKNKYGKMLKKQSIRNNYNGASKFVHGANDTVLLFKKITKHEYESLISNENLINDIVDIQIPIVQSNTNYNQLYAEFLERRLNNLII